MAVTKEVSFAVCEDCKGYTGWLMTFRYGGYSFSQKQKLNTKGSTKVEVVGANDALLLVLWTLCFVEGQGYAAKKNKFNQDNISSIKLKKNRKGSS